ncbi:neutral zinc metallopeptidase [Geodermatophilus sp. YIM 151500]|uniref:neutral zinc metallopeptidase n=1 Tax=Geodermatophilus sp. YIM 151500 TaxID=2984531 RepID=UPI0021E3ADB7|nr:neutral zinc metallopeptidase [Geodermatophilus sp. YIM 151500]MCV2491559.1 neutral zinc metallopeptidase [Geodermatophilus sp. YIM 151500]
MQSPTHPGLRAVLVTAAVAAGLTVLPGTAAPAAAATADPATADPAAADPATADLATADPAATAGTARDATAASAARAGSMWDFLQTQLLDVHEYWSRFQGAAGGPATSVDYVFPVPGEVFPTSCGPSDDNSMFYCPADDLVVFSQDVAIRLWNGEYQVNPDDHAGKVAGDFAVALMVAHEYAHNVQWEIGLGTDPAEFPLIALELHADCWAGVWMNDSYYAGQLQGTDVEEAVATMERLGDYEVGNPTTHGTPAQRAAAFLHGYDSGEPVACDAVLTHSWL